MFGQNTKPTEFQDKRTGEMVSQLPVPEDQWREIEKHMQAHQNGTAEFMGLSMQLVLMQKRQLELHEILRNAEERVKNSIVQAQRKLKLDPKEKWAYNVQLRVMERRTPPDFKPVEPSKENANANANGHEQSGNPSDSKVS